MQTAYFGQHTANFRQFVTYFRFWRVGYELVTQLCPKLAFSWLFYQTPIHKKSPTSY